MNWIRQDLVLGEQVEFPLIERHLPFAEMCDLYGACAILDGKEALAEAIEGFLLLPILHITGLACSGEVEFRESYLVGEAFCDFPIQWKATGLSGQAFFRANPNVPVIACDCASNPHHPQCISRRTSSPIPDGHSYHYTPEHDCHPYDRGVDCPACKAERGAVPHS